MNRLSPKGTTVRRLYRGEGIPVPYAARYPGRMCSFRPISAVLALVPDSLVVLIGPAICTFNAQISNRSNGAAEIPGLRPRYNRFFVTLDRHDITFGTEGKVRKAIVSAVRRCNPANVFVVTSCLQELIAEDFDSFVQELDRELEPSIIAIHSDNFRSEDPAVGVAEAVAALIRLMPPLAVKPGTFNVLGMRLSGLERSELLRSLAGAGMKVNASVPNPAAAGLLGSAAQAEFNLVVDHHGILLAEEMRRRFGTPYVHIEKSFSPEAVEADYQRLAAFLGETFDRRYRPPAAPQWESLHEVEYMCRGLSAVITTLHGRTLSLVRLLIRLGMDVKTIFLKQFDLWDRDDLEALISCGFDADIIRGDDRLAIEDVLAELRPDFAFGFLEPEARSLLRRAYIPMRAAERRYGYPVVETLLDRMEAVTGAAGGRRKGGAVCRM